MLGERALEYAKRAGLNKYYLPVVEVELGGVTFSVFGSMSWTVATVRAKTWDEIQPAYVAITGDHREDADEDAGKNVVAGELQKHWAEYHGRDDLIESIEEQQEARIKFALQDPPATPAGTKAAYRRTTQGGSMAKKGGGKKAAKKESSGGSGNIPQKGASGMAASLISGGDHSRESVMKKVSEAFPNVKNVAPAVSYAARCVGVTLE